MCMCESFGGIKGEGRGGKGERGEGMEIRKKGEDFISKPGSD